MISSVGSSQASHASEAANPAAPKSQQTQQKSVTQPSDTVTLKSAGDAERAGDNK